MKAFTTLIRKIIAATAFILALGLVIPVISGSGMTQVQAATKGTVTSMTLMKGDKSFFNIEDFPAGATVKFTSSKKSVATVNAKTGQIVAKKAGNCKITATVTTTNKKSKKYTCNVKVTAVKKKSYGEFTEVSSKNDFIEIVKNGGNIKLTSSIGELTDTIICSKNVVIDLNGKMLKVNTSDKNGFLQISNGGSLTIIDSSVTKTGTIINFGNGGMIHCFDGSVTIEDGEFTGGGYMLYSEGKVTVNEGSFSSFSDYGIYTHKGETIINDGSFTGTGRLLTTGESGRTFMNGGSLCSDDDCVEINAGASMFLNGGLISSGKYGIEIFGGEAVMNGATLKCSGPCFYLGSGNLIVNAGTVTSEKTNNSYCVYSREPKDKVSVTFNGGTLSSGYVTTFLYGGNIAGVYVNGGTFNGSGDVAFAIEDCPMEVKAGKITGTEYAVLMTGSEDTSSLTITGGTLKARKAVEVHGAGTLKITGGTFKGDKYDLVLAEDYSGQDSYNKKLVKKVFKASDDSTKDQDKGTVKRVNVKYKEGMTVDKLNTLYSLCMDCCENLVPEIQIMMSDAMYETFKQNVLTVWIPSVAGYYEATGYNAKVSYYSKSDALKKYTIKWNFGKENQIYCLSKNPKLSDKVDDDVKTYNKKIDKIIDSIITDGMTDREKIDAVHDYMCENYEYANPIDEKTDHSYHAMLDDGTGVCQAYASLFHIFMLKLGIEDELITGESSNTPWGSQREPHMWNKLVLDGKILYVDVTWDDGSKSDKYFLKSKKDFYADGTHFEN